MATFVILGNFTEQGLRNARDSVKRADMVKEAAAKVGIRMREILWTLGTYDFVVTFEAPDDAAMTAFALTVGSAGNVRTQTMRAFTHDEMAPILAKLG